jgi:hypothetical protein
VKKAASTLLIIIVLVITMSIPVFAAGSSDTTVILNPVVTSSNAQEGVVVTGDTIQVSIASSTRIVFEGENNSVKRIRIKRELRLFGILSVNGNTES